MIIKSLLCLEEPLTNPYLTVHNIDDKWKQVIKHDLYRRQDYPKCKEISHYMCIMNSDYVNKLNNNLYNEETVWYELEKRVNDIDYEKDLKCGTNLKKELQ